MEGQERQRAAGKNEPEFLYHYTTENGLDGILKSDSIWATHYRFLNDLSECLEAPELFEARMGQRSSVKSSQSDLARKGREAYWNNTRNTLRAKVDLTDV
jgi:hypothetical protein